MDYNLSLQRLKMKFNRILFSFLIGFAILMLAMFNIPNASAQVIMQQPTGSIPTVTGTPKGPVAAVSIDQEDPVNVRSGPGTLYDEVGVLLPGQEAPVLGRTSGGDWLLIEYPGGPNNQGWVYAPIVLPITAEIPIVEIPPTVTPLMTNTINPTLAAQFITTPVPTRLATYTPVDPLIVATYQDMARTSILGGIPMGLVILIIAGTGAILALLSLIRNR